MRVQTTALPGHLALELTCHGDTRGFFMESFRANRYRDLGIHDEFVQDNLSKSSSGILRGLHYQIARPLARLVTLTQGKVFDVAVDVRCGSPTFGKWAGIILSESGVRQVYLPAGFAHGFCVLGETSTLHYKMSGYFDPADEGGIAWNDPDLGIDWPIGPSTISTRDMAFPRLSAVEQRRLPAWTGQ